MKTIHVKGRYFEWDNSEPFFYLADTAWELLHRLNKEETEQYLRVRSHQGFTVIQTVALAELDGLTRPNAYGRYPLTIPEDDTLPDPAHPDAEGKYSYWDHVDFVVETAAKYGLFIGLLPTWGDKFNPLWGTGPCIFTPENAYAYGKWIGRRYRNAWNIIWILGGDRPLDERTRPIIDRMAEGIRSEDYMHLMSYHPSGGHNSLEYLKDAVYMDFHMLQSGHGVEKCYSSDTELLEMAKVSNKPYMDAESRYEDHPACFNTKLKYYWGPAEVRQNAYWNVLAGACGQTYGNHCMWSCNEQPGEYFPYHWNEVLRHEAAEQMRWLKALRMRREFSSFHPTPEVLDTQYEGCGHLAAAGGNDYCYIYSPLGAQFTLNLSAIGDSDTLLRAIWYDPRSGEETLFGIFPCRGKSLFVPPTRGYGEDWVLILEAPE